MLYRLERGPAALASLAPVLLEYPGLGCALAVRAAISMQLGREGEALADYVAALKVMPADAGLCHAYGHALRAIGRQADAVQAYRRVLDLAPTFAEAWWSLANLKTWCFEAGDIARMETALGRADLDIEGRSYVHFALGKAREDAGHYPAAFDQYRRANAARRTVLSYDADAHSAFIKRNIATFTSEFLAARAGLGDPPRTRSSCSGCRAPDLR